MTASKISSSGPRRAADIDHVAVTDRGILVDEAGDQHAAVERDDLAVLFAGRRARRADIVLAARAALEAQLLRGGLVGQMHDDTAGLAGADHIGLPALPARRSFGAGPVVGILERGEAPAADDLVGADARGHLR